MGANGWRMLACAAALAAGCQEDGDAGGGDAAPPAADAGFDGAAPPPDVGPDAGGDAVTPPPDAGLDAATPDGGVGPGLRFAIEVSNDIPESIYVQLNEEDGQPAWVVVRRGDERVWFDERCEVQDCEDPGGVCGAALPRVRDITGGGYSGSIERRWDGVTSVVEGGCERRVVAPDGDYVARFCWSNLAEVEGGDPVQGAPGRVAFPECADVSFRLPGAREVVHRIEGG